MIHLKIFAVALVLQADYHSAIGGSENESSSGYYGSESNEERQSTWQYPHDMAALATLSMSRFKIGYAYQLMTLNLLLPQHKIMVKIRMGRSGDGE
jgi:hypothetical protein